MGTGLSETQKIYAEGDGQTDRETEADPCNAFTQEFSIRKPAKELAFVLAYVSVFCFMV